MNKYLEISKELLNRINNKTYNNSTNPIPNEIQLSKEFNCSRMTMRRAIDILVQEGIIYRRRGAGSFIRDSMTSTCSPKFKLDNNIISGLTQTIDYNIDNKLISFKLIFATESIKNALSIKLNDPVYEIVRIRYINTSPYVVEKTYMDASIISGITEDILAKSIYKYIEKELNLSITGSKKILRASPSNQLDREYLLLSENEPVLEVEQIAYLSSGKAFEYSFSRHRYDKFEFTSFTSKK